MGKKNDSKSKAAEVARVGKPGKKKAAKAPGRAPKRGKSKAAAPSISQHDIALRAYFISEKRRRDGLPGDERHDWIEAERQIAREHRAAARLAS